MKDGIKFKVLKNLLNFRISPHRLVKVATDVQSFKMYVGRISPGGKA